MLVVETIGKIRRAHLVWGKSIKAICRDLNAKVTAGARECAEVASWNGEAFSASPSPRSVTYAASRNRFT